ncbi:chalcone isomerase family protein [Shewanella sp. BF02_Schw]|uniref:chalcone isomerase family protein n=1 Tax=Shewanella sp. BF02_Schw TaxID=394908 RepID=UPI0017865EA8|nr:chalcone isomerase family protein [Shewanella sp. BF02_Schw]MBO1894390.1 chalcone isomerase family protein [Shewanella sp. BF02_Schw]
MKTLHNGVKSQPHIKLHQSSHWLVELLFGVVGALVLTLIVAVSINDASANDINDKGEKSDISDKNDKNGISDKNDISGISDKNGISDATLIQVGTADMSLLWLDIYSAKLFSIDGKYQANRFPMILDIQYHRDIDAIDLVDATIEQWQHLGFTEANIELYRQQLVNAWPDVKQGDRLTFKVNTPEDAAFLLNDTPYYQVSNAQFPEAFLGIWLSEKTSRPELRNQLIGVN